MGKCTASFLNTLAPTHPPTFLKLDEDTLYVQDGVGLGLVDPARRTLPHLVVRLVALVVHRSLRELRHEVLELCAVTVTSDVTASHARTP